MTIGCEPQEGEITGSRRARKPSEPPPEGFQWPTNPPPDTASSEYRLDWNLTTLVGAYERAGKRNESWDGPVVEALTAFAHLRAKDKSSAVEQTRIMRENIARAIEAGCDDPLIDYLYTRDHLAKTLSADEHGKRFAQVAKALGASDYPPVRKFYGYMRAYKVNMKPWEPLKERRGEVYLKAWRTMEILVLDRKVPISEIYEALGEWFDACGSSNLGEYVQDRILAPILDTWGATVDAQILHARFYIEYGWRARGGGLANTVTEEGWQSFFERIGIAETILQDAYARDPEDIRAPLLMLEVAVDQQYERDAMDVWFQRAMNLDTNCYEACSRKLRYLEPKWYGSPEDMVGFARECVDSTTWGPRIPLIMIDTHEVIARYFKSPSEREAYWKQPPVWNDLHHAIETYLQRCPNEYGYRHTYAKYAYKCEQWDALNEQLQLIQKGTVDYDYFGGRDAFDTMVRRAESNGRPVNP